MTAGATRDVAERIARYDAALSDFRNHRWGIPSVIERIEAEFVLAADALRGALVSAPTPASAAGEQYEAIGKQRARVISWFPKPESSGYAVAMMDLEKLEEMLAPKPATVASTAEGAQRDAMDEFKRLLFAMEGASGNEFIAQRKKLFDFVAALLSARRGVEDCEGCARGMPLTHSIHCDAGSPYMACKAGRYQEPVSRPPAASPQAVCPECRGKGGFGSGRKDENGEWDGETCDVCGGKGRLAPRPARVEAAEEQGCAGCVQGLPVVQRFHVRDGKPVSQCTGDRLAIEVEEMAAHIASHGLKAEANYVRSLIPKLARSAPAGVEARTSHVCSYEWLADGSFGCEQCDAAASPEGGRDA